MSSGKRAVKGEGEEEETASGSAAAMGARAPCAAARGRASGSIALRGGLGCRRGKARDAGGSSEGAAEDGGGGDVALVDWIDPIWEDPEVDAGVWRRRVRERWDN